jgi:TonB family protein
LGDGVGIRLKGGSGGSGTGTIDYDAIARVVDQYKNGLVYLYNKELRTNPTLKGTISVEFSIDSSGKVIDTRIVSTTMNHTPLEQALASRIKMWRFPHLYDGIIIVTYPFVFFPV